MFSQIIVYTGYHADTSILSVSTHTHPLLPVFNVVSVYCESTVIWSVNLPPVTVTGASCKFKLGRGGTLKLGEGMGLGT